MTSSARESCFLKDMLLQRIAGLTFYGNRLSGVWNRDSHELLRFCLRNEVITQRELEDAVEARLRWCGRHCFEMLAKPHVSGPSHVPSPQALAYAIEHKELTPKEVRSIMFDDGHDRRTFVEKWYPRAVVHRARDQLISGPFTIFGPEKKQEPAAA